MNFEHLSPINSDGIFFERFRKKSFLEKIARWAKRLCYGFLIITAATMVVQLISPFGNDVPDLFMQLLFFLIFWGTIEVLTLPLEYIQDYYIFDFEKNWLALSQQRFFYRRVVVIAAFNQIKAIGVSSQPHMLSQPLADSNQNRYAIFVQTLRNQLVQVSDFELSLEEANAFCHRLYSSHFSGAAYIGGAPGMEIFVDPVSGELSTRDVRKNIQTVAELLSLPLTQAALAFLITLSVMSLSLSVIQKISSEMFAADLKIRHQPVFQLIAGLPPKSTDIIDDKASPASSTIVLELPASAAVTIDLQGQQVVVSPPPTIASAPEVSETAEDQRKKAQEPPPTKGSLQIPPETVVLAEIPENRTDSVKIQKPEISVSDKSGKAEKKIEMRAFSQHPVVKTPMQMPEISAKVPDFPANQTREIGNPYQEMPIEGNRSFKTLSHSIPDYNPNLKPKKIALNLTRISSKALSEAETGHASILPGYGIHPIIQIGDSIEKAIKQFGEPPSSFQTEDESQLIYQGLSLIINKNNGRIEKILISVNSRFSNLRTPQGIGIGSSFSELEEKMGPYSLDKKAPGLHFANQGISFLPDLQQPQRIGSIQIYRLSEP